jgi:cell division protein FtsB
MARRTGWVAAGAVVLAYAWIAVRGPQGIGTLMEKHSEIRELEEQNAAIVRQNQALRERIQRLEESDSEKELEVRKQLKLLRPGETTFLNRWARSPTCRSQAGGLRHHEILLRVFPRLAICVLAPSKTGRLGASSRRKVQEKDDPPWAYQLSGFEAAKFEAAKFLVEGPSPHCSR